MRWVAGATSHPVFTTWRSLVPNPDQGLETWVYQPLVEWTCGWAAGCGNEKDICDAIVQQLHTSGLRYGVHAWTVRDMLNQQGGMCGGWYRMLQQMAHTQGVFLHRRSFLVDWRMFPGGVEEWRAMVIRGSGLNQPAPTHAASTYHDHDGPYTGAANGLVARTERRYRFWSGLRPGMWGDGHCINILEYAGQLYLYDACFGTGPYQIAGPLPPDNMTVWGGTQLASFKSTYLDGAVDYMLGSLYNGGQLIRAQPPAANGVTVKTEMIPTQVNGRAGLTFGWGA